MKCYVRALSQLLGILPVCMCHSAWPGDVCLLPSTDIVWGLSPYHSPFCLWLTWLVQPEDSLKHTPERRHEGEQDAPAPTLHLPWVQNGQEGGTPLGNESPCTAFIKVTSEDQYLLFLGRVFFNSLTLPRMHPPFVGILPFLRLRIIVARIAVAAVFRGVTVCPSCL